MPFCSYVPAIPVVCDYTPIGFLSSLPEGYPIQRRKTFTSQEEADQFYALEYIRQDEEAEWVSKRYDLASFVALNQLVQISIEDWLGLRADPFYQKYGLPEIIKRGLAFETGKIVRERESLRNEEKRKIQMEQSELKSKLNFGPTNNTFSKVYG